MQRNCNALRERACAALRCTPAELRVNPTPEGLIELRVACTFSTHGLSSAVLVGNFEELEQCLSRKADAFDDDAPVS
jgi:hypothetical protein